jgi:NADH-quinone oxidoreductase subunit M
MVILASFKGSFWYAFFAAVTLILGAAYSLWLVKRVVFGPIGNSNVEKLEDVDGREFLVLGVLAAAVFIFGIWPEPIINLMGASVHHLVDQAVATKLPL